MNGRRVMKSKIPHSPSLDYTLGWWMISRILDAPGGYDTVMRLLSAPDQLFSEYNRAIFQRFFASPLGQKGDT